MDQRRMLTLKQLAKVGGITPRLLGEWLNDGYLGPRPEHERRSKPVFSMEDAAVVRCIAILLADDLEMDVETAAAHAAKTRGAKYGDILLIAHSEETAKAMGIATPDCFHSPSETYGGIRPSTDATMALPNVTEFPDLAMIGIAGLEAEVLSVIGQAHSGG